MAITQLKAYEEFVEFITSYPTIEDVTNFHLSDESQQAIRDLLDANRSGNLTSQEAEELDEYIRLEHIIQQAKVRVYEKLSHI